MPRKDSHSPTRGVSRRHNAPKYQDFFQLLRQRIVTHDVLPGSRLREQELADEYGVPRAKVREALLALQERGLVERIPNRGAVVIKLDLDQVVEIYQVREALEGLAARLATINAEHESWQDLIELFDEPMQTHVDKGDYEEFVSGYELFRFRVIKAASNPVLATMIDGIYEKTQVLIRRVIVLPGRAHQGLKEHRAVLAAMRRGDAEEAELCRRQSLRSALETMTHYKNFIF